ncbi:MAG TPA: ATP-grasp domain-containing protein [Pirellulaceae bacterium]|nr:ATP-grasp domain-containing protein [Pirellulaceae bacterium]HMO92158.1 ATP-grasp domain-containing protein [Pirellulaceae bacterium]HMP68916.1 ATP-grasp domain-containing protein [Pirellulaceae bacterium]
MTKTVLMISPGFPVEQPFFTRGLAQTGAHVLGLGDQAEHDLPPIARESLSAYIQVPSFSDESAIMHRVLEAAQKVRIDQVECTWEPYMTLAAQIRERLGLPGMSVAQTLPFRDKEIMKQVLDRHGIRTPRHFSTTTADGVRQAAHEIGFPVCVKPIAGAGSADTYRVDNADVLEQVLPRLRHVAEVSVEEFIEAEEFTFDTICVDGEIKYFNICRYRPRPLIGRQNEWISQQTIALKDVDSPDLKSGREMGFAVIKALGFQTGFTHMEWYRKADGEAVFGEIGARPPGANTVELMNYACDIDTFRGWGEAVIHHQFSQPIVRKYNCASIFKRAQGQGRIRHIEGLEKLMYEYGEHVCVVDLLPIGAPRRNWLQTLRSDGMIIVRHPDYATVCEIADQFGIRLQLYAG